MKRRDKPNHPNGKIDLPRLIQENKRGANDFFTWRQNKAVVERTVATEALKAAGFHPENLKSCSDDPPDCKASIEGVRCAIEVTELCHQSTLDRNIKADKQRKAGKEPENAEAYFVWERADLIEKLQNRIDDKEQKLAKAKGGPYGRYILVIHTDEDFLNRSLVEDFTSGATFHVELINDVLLLLSYEPPDYPVFRLSLEKKDVMGSKR